MKHVLKQLTVMCCTIGQNHFIHHDHLGYIQHDKACNIVNCLESTQTDYPHCWPCERMMTLTFHIFFFECLVRLIEPFVYLCSSQSLFCLFCHVLALIVLVLQGRCEKYTNP